MEKVSNYLLNGEVYEGAFSISSSNRAFRYGDAVFETIKVSQRHPLFYRSHYSRLVRGLDALQIHIPEDFTFQYFLHSLKNLLQAGKIENGAIRLQAWRSGKGSYTAKQNDFQWLAEVSSAENTFFQEEAGNYQLGVYQNLRKNYSAISEFKTSNAIPYVLAANFAQQQSLQNVLILNDQDNVVETVAENVFIYSDGMVTTPPLTDGCIDGIMRSMLKKIFIWNKIDFREESIRVQDVENAQEVFLTNSLKGIVPVSHFRQKHYFNAFSNGLQLKLNERIAQILEKQS